MPKMKMIALKLVCLVLVAGPCNIWGFDKLAVTAKLDVNNEEKIHVLFQVKAAADTEIGTAALPWFSPVGLTLVVVRAGTGECLKRVYLPQSPLIGNTQLKANQACEGRLDLETYFPNLKSENKDRDLIFFWHCLAPNGTRAAFENKEEGYAGWILLPRYFKSCRQEANAPK
jgi:hypothetical protein